MSCHPHGLSNTQPPSCCRHTLPPKGVKAKTLPVEPEFLGDGPQEILVNVPIVRQIARSRHHRGFVSTRKTNASGLPVSRVRSRPARSPMGTSRGLPFLGRSTRSPCGFTRETSVFSMALTLGSSPVFAPAAMFFDMSCDMESTFRLVSLASSTARLWGYTELQPEVVVGIEKRFEACGAPSGRFAILLQALGAEGGVGISAPWPIPIGAPLKPCASSHCKFRLKHDLGPAVVTRIKMLVGIRRFGER